MKKIGMYLLAGAAAVILSACGSSQEEAAASSGVVDTQADKGLEVMGDQVVYDPNHLVNDGQPVSLDWWIWTSEDTFTAIAEEYEKIHPNVSIRVVYNPWDGYFTKLPLSLQKKEDGPALFNIHNSYDSLLLITRRQLPMYGMEKFIMPTMGFPQVWCITIKDSGKRQGSQKRIFQRHGMS